MLIRGGGQIPPLHTKSFATIAFSAQPSETLSVKRV